MGGELMGDLLPNGQLDVYQRHAYYKYSQRASHQASRFCSGLHSGLCKKRDNHGTKHKFWS